MSSSRISWYWAAWLWNLTPSPHSSARVVRTGLNLMLGSCTSRDCLDCPREWALMAPKLPHTDFDPPVGSGKDEAFVLGARKDLIQSAAIASFKCSHFPHGSLSWSLASLWWDFWPFCSWWVKQILSVWRLIAVRHFQTLSCLWHLSKDLSHSWGYKWSGWACQTPAHMQRTPGCPNGCDQR